MMTWLWAVGIAVGIAALAQLLANADGHGTSYWEIRDRRRQRRAEHADRVRDDERIYTHTQLEAMTEQQLLDVLDDTRRRLGDLLDTDDVDLRRARALMAVHDDAKQLYEDNPERNRARVEAEVRAHVQACRRREAP